VRVVHAVKPVAERHPGGTYTGCGQGTGRRGVLNIGKLAPGAADYYLGEVATSAEDYYTGRGESPGRWVGSLAARLGLTGTVDPADFRAVLEGRHPVTGEHLVSGRAASCRARRLPHPSQRSLFDDDVLDVPRVAARLRVSSRHVRRLLAAGSRAAAEGTPVRLGTTLVGKRSRVSGQRGPLSWSVPRSEVERFEAERRAVKTRPGYDLTLRPPKSVSVLWALADEPHRRAIRDAHRAAVDAVVAYYERHGCYARRPTAERGRVETDGLIAAAFDHRTSRAGDPLLHSHVVCANLTRTAEGRWQAIDGRPIYEHAHAAGYLYQAHLRHVLSTILGVRFGPVRKGYAEVDGVAPEVIRAFSKRRDEIEQLVAESGYTSARAHQAATLATRKAKDYGVDSLTLEDAWRTEAAELGFGPDEVEACFGTAVKAPPVDKQDLFTGLAGPQGLTCQASTFTRQDVVEALAEAAGEALPAERIDDLASEFLASEQVRALAAQPGQPGCGLWRRDGTRQRSPDLARYTTPELLELEQRILAWGSDGLGGPVPAAEPHGVAVALDRRPHLSPEQVTMVRTVCGPAPALQPAAGRPGSGKTQATAACVDAFLSSGVPVVGCALSAVAAGELEAATGLLERTGRPATTIASLFHDLERAGLAPGTILIVDEASMVGTRDLARLGMLVARAGGAMKLIGDPDQHGPVETGGVFRRLVSAAGPDAPNLVGNNRQTDVGDRQAVEAFRQELVELALSRYDDAGRIVRSPTAARSYDAMVSDWWEHVRTGATDPMIAGTNHVRRALNERARTRLVAEGMVEGPALTVGHETFQPGDWLVARRNARFLRSPDGRDFVKNGSAGCVAGVDLSAGSLTVDFAVEGRVELPASYVRAGHVEHGYARTSYGVQGATLDRAFYHPADSSSFEEGYVALTRGRVETRIYLVDAKAGGDAESDHRAHEHRQVGLETISEALERRRSKTLALDVDPLAAESISAFYGWSLQELRRERERLQAVLASAPPPVDDAVAAITRQRDALLARKQAWTDAAQYRPRRLGLGVRSHRTTTPPERLDAIERAIAGAERQLARLQERQRQREAFFEQHAAEVERLRLLHRAELAGELQVRAGAVVEPSPSLLDPLGPPPEDPVRYQRWRHAMEQAAVHTQRHGVGGIDTDPLEAPSAARARRASYERAAGAVRAFLEEPEVDVAEPEVLLDR
jgi:conjugative relaxase-like TrwC/TraI family protein